MLFDKIIYINLKRRTDRLEHMTKLLNEYNLSQYSERLEATDGRELNLDKIDNNIITSNGIDDAKNSKKVYTVLTAGAIGCIMSHRAIYQKIVDDNINSCLILEDDVRFDAVNGDELMQKLNILENNITFDYDLLFLGFSPSTLKFSHMNVNDYFYKLSRIYGLFGYIVTNKGAKKLLNMFPLSQQLDTEISNHSKFINIYSVKKNLVLSEPSEINREFGTDIQIREKINPNKFYKKYLIFMILVIIIIIFILYKLNCVQKISKVIL